MARLYKFGNQRLRNLGKRETQSGAPVGVQTSRQFVTEETSTVLGSIERANACVVVVMVAPKLDEFR